MDPPRVEYAVHTQRRVIARIHRDPDVRIAKVLAWSAAGLLILLMVSIAVLLSLDLETYRRPLQSELSTRLGRPVTLGGAMSWKVSLWPTMVVEGIAVGNPPWASRPEFVRAERLLVQVALPSLLRRHLEILQLRLDGADVLFEYGPDAAKNWVFGKDEQGSLALPEIDSLTCERCVLGYRRPSGKVQRLNISTISAVLDIGEPIQLQATASYGDAAFSISLLGGTPEALVQSKTPWPISLELRVGGATLEIEGAATRPLEGKDFDLRVTARGEQLADLAQLLDITLPALGPYRLSGRVTEADGKYTLSEAEARLGSPGTAGYFVVTEAAASLALDQPTELRAAGRYNGLSFSTSLSGGTFTELISPTGPWPVKLSTRVGETLLHVDGMLARPLSAEAYDLYLKVVGPGGAELERLARVNLPAFGTYSLACRVQVRDGDYVIGALKGFVNSVDGATRVTIIDGRASARAGAPVALEIKGTYLDAPFAVAFQGGTLTGLFEAKPWPVKLRADMLGSVFDIKGSFARPLEGEGMDLQVKASGPQMYQLQRLVPLPPLGPYEFSAHVVDSKDGYSATDVKVHVDAGEMTGAFAFERRAGRTYIRIRLGAETLDLKKLIQTETNRGAQAALVPWDVPIALPLLRALDADVDLQIKRITAGATEIGHYMVATRLRDGHLMVKPLRVQLPGARMEAEIELDVRGDAPVFLADVSASRADVGELLKTLLNVDGLRGVAEDVELRIKGSGQTTRALLPQATVKLSAKNGAFEYDRVGSEPIRIKLSALAATIDDGGPLQLTVEGAFRDAPYSASFSGVPLAHLLAGDTHWPVTLSAQAAGASLMAKGTLTWPPGSAGWGLTFTLQGQRLDGLSPLVGMQLPALGPYELGARLESAGRTYKLSDLELRVDDNHATGSLELATGDSNTRIAAELSADELDLDDWVTWLESLRVQKTETTRADLVLPSFTVPVEQLRRTELRVALEVGKIRARGTDFGNIRANVQAANGRLVIVPLTASVAGGEISATLQLDATADTPSVLAQLSVSQLDYGRWLKAFQVTDKAEGVVDVELTLTGRGATLRDMLADADGAVLLVSGPARFTGGGLELWGAGLTTGLMAMTTMALGVERSTPFNCMVWPVNVVHGVARSEAILIDTPKITVTGSGTLNFATEKVDLLLRPARKKASLFSFDNPVRVTGTLANPQPTAVGKLETVVRLLLPFLNPAFLLLSADIGTGQGNRCVQALADADAKAEAANKETNVRGEARNLLRKLQRPIPPSPR